MTDTFLRRCRAVITEVCRLWSTDNRDNDLKQFVIQRLGTVKRSVRGATGNLIPLEIAEELQQAIDETIASLEQDPPNNEPSVAYRAPRVLQASGRPKYHISEQQLLFLKQSGFTAHQMADIFGVSVRTVERRLRAYHISLKEYAELSDEALDDEVRRVVCDNPLLGPNAVCARLEGIGVHIQRQRVRESMLRTYPQYAAIRALEPRLHRRTYKVAAPNSLWHLDGNHKLIRWRMVIHGCVDGYSRLFTFLKASDNNRSDTVLGCFVEAVSTYGFPSRVRCDYGGENNDVCDIMELVRGRTRASAIRGRSTHNQRIERAWVDVWNGVSNLYYDLFCFMEDNNILNVDSELHLWALHFIFLPRLNSHLQLFQSQWNNHALRTEHHRSPLQLFVHGILAHRESNLSAIRDLFVEDIPQGNIEIPGGLDEAQLVEVPASNYDVPPHQLQTLRQLVDRHDDTHDNLGLALYSETVTFLTGIQDNN